MPFTFDRVFDQYATQYEVFQHTTQALVTEVLNGYNCACFAYGATGAGKTFTMVGSESAPGVMVLTLQELFSAMKANQDEKRYSVKISYLEVYNENIHDLLVPQSKPLALLESGDNMTVLGLTSHEPKSAEEVLILLQEGNTRRAQNFTHANAESSRSHAVLQVMVEQRDRTANVTTGVRSAKFSLIDLAGSERASRTKNQGKQLVEGANINRSLLALGNCINALGNGYTEGKYVPYRDSKLTRLLKDSLGGNCKTIMISNVSPSTLSYEDTFNTLQYANRAKNIKTKVRANEINIVSHVSEYKHIIADLRKEVEEWKTKCSQFEQQLEEEGRARQAEIDDAFDAEMSKQAMKTAETPSALRAARNGMGTMCNSSANASGNAPLPLLSRTVSMGLQTPRNSKNEKRLINWSSEIDDLVSDRRNVQIHLDQVNATISELSERKTRAQQAIYSKRENSKTASPADMLRSKTPSALLSDASSIDSTAGESDSICATPVRATPSKRNFELTILAKRELDVVSRKLEENYSERSILLQRLGRNAESCKRIQVEMAKVTPHAEDASLYRQLKLELVINVLEISNFNRAMQESQLAHALAQATAQNSRAVELIDYLRSALGDCGYEETNDLVQKIEMAHLPTEEPLNAADLPSPFSSSTSNSTQSYSMSSPTASYAMGGSPSMFAAEEVPSTPSRFSIDASAFSSAIKEAQASSQDGMFSARGSISARNGINASVSRNTAINAGETNSPLSARRVPRAPLSTTNTTAKVSSAAQTNTSNRVAATTGARSTIKAKTTTSVTNATTTHVRTSSQPSAKKSAVVSSRAPRASMIPTAPASATKEKRGSTTSAATSAASATTVAKRSATSTLGGAQRISTVSTYTRNTGVSQATSNSATTKPFQSHSDAKRITPTKLSHKYRQDPIVAKALATFKPAFEPQERSTPPSSAVGSIGSATRHVKVSSTGSAMIASAENMNANLLFAESPTNVSTPTTPRGNIAPQKTTSSASGDSIVESATMASNRSFKFDSNPLALLLQPSVSGASLSSNMSLTSNMSAGGPTSDALNANGVTSTTPTSSRSAPGAAIGVVHSPSSPSLAMAGSPLFTAAVGNVVHSHIRSNSGPSSPMSPAAKPLRV